jgi:hypothetical protein
LLKIPYVCIEQARFAERDTDGRLDDGVAKEGRAGGRAVASTGVGVFDTLKAVAKQVLTELRKS